MKSEKGGMKSGRSARGGGDMEQVKAAQEALKDKGMDPGPADGVMGPKTRQALREFQKKEGLKESGRLDAETMDKLGVHKTSSTAGGSSSGSMGSSSSTGSGSSSGSSPSASPGGSQSPSTGGSSTSSGSSSGATK
jgi:peptidoglycan hydrolase-like protein with peptidoglycan-binding domain